MRTKPVDVAVDGVRGRDAGRPPYTVHVHPVRGVHRLIEVKGQVVDDVTRLRHRRRSNEPIQTRLPQQQNKSIGPQREGTKRTLAAIAKRMPD